MARFYMRTSTTQSAAGSGALEARGSVPSVNNHRIVPAPFACPEPRRAQPHPRKPFLATRHSLAQRRNTADEGPLTTEILIANLELEFRLTHRKIISLKISNRKKIAIFYPVFRRGAKTVLPPSFPSGRGFIPSINRRRIVTVPLVYPEARRAQLHPRKPFPRFASTEFTPFAPPHPCKPATRHPSLITGSLIYGGAIRNPCKHRKFSDIQISNRR